MKKILMKNINEENIEENINQENIDEENINEENQILIKEENLSSDDDIDSNYLMKIKKKMKLLKLILMKNMKIYFPPDINGNGINLRMTNIGLYSTSRTNDARNITNIILSYCDNSKNKIITDATAGLGGNVISFASKFKKINAVEINNLHCEMLEHNINQYTKFDKKIKIYNNDYIKIMDNIKQNIIFIDPPWGGPSYYEERLKLYLGDLLLDLL